MYIILMIITSLIACLLIYLFVWIVRNLNEMRSESANNISILEINLNAKFKDLFAAQESQNNIRYTAFIDQINTSITMQQNQLGLLQQQLGHIAQLNESKMDSMRRTLHESISKLQDDNNNRLESIRLTVEEKLQSTLEKRLGESFKIVSERLEMVYKGLGEMQNLASGVGDLKKVLTNVKTRGIWGEVQLDGILQQVMLSDQYSKNVAVKANSQDRVEYALKLPGKDDDAVVWLPIDAKFPLDDYHRLIEAEEIGDIEEAKRCGKLLEASLKKSAKTIAEKYINPPATTDFAIMFLPIEGLYAEALKRSNIIEMMQREYRIVLTSPTTLCAILNSLQMGFKTIAIEKHSSQVWKVLESIKPEFVKFSDLLSKTRVKLEQASQAINDAETRTRIIQKKLNKAAQPIANEVQHSIAQYEDGAI